MSDQIVVMRDGAIEQRGTPDEIYDRPRTAFVADFIGSSNLIRGRLRPDLSRDGMIALETDGGQVVHGLAHGRDPGPEPTMSLRTVHLHLDARPPEGELNVWPATVRRSVFLGDLTELHVDWGGRELVVRRSAGGELAPGQPAYLSADPRRCVLLEAPSPPRA